MLSTSRARSRTQSPPGLRSPRPDSDELVAWLTARLEKEGPSGLALEELDVLHQAASFPIEWRKLTGAAPPEGLVAQLADRLQQAGHYERQSLRPGEVSGLIFLKAAATGDVESLSTWLESKERLRLLRAVDEHGRSAVHLAAGAGHTDVLRLLYGHGADMDKRDRRGRTALLLSSEYGWAPATEVLLDCGCVPGTADRKGRTALHLAVCCEDARVSRLLVDRNQHLVDRRDVHSRTPLFHSVLNVNPQALAECSRLVIEKRAEVNARDCYGMTPLHYAVQEDRHSAVNLLLRFKSDPTIEDRVKGRSAIQLACSNGVRRALEDAAGLRSPPPSGDPGGGNMRPGATQLAAPFHALQTRFVDIMRRVQEGGLQQMEHIKHPHLFTGSWMATVSNHQQLLGQALKYLPGPEVCIRVFNLLHPPQHFPAPRGDEGDIMRYYGEQKEHPGWGGDDPYAGLSNGTEDQAGAAYKGEVMRKLQEQRQLLEEKESLIEELRRTLAKMQMQLADCIEPETAKVLRARAAKAQADLMSTSEDLAVARNRAAELEGQNRVLQDKLDEEKARNDALLAEHFQVRRQLDDELMRRGQEQSWHLLYEKEQEKAMQLQQRLQSGESEAAQSSSAMSALQGEVNRLTAELARQVATSEAGQAAERRRQQSAERQLREQLEAQQQEAVKQATLREAQAVQKLSDAELRAEALQREMDKAQQKMREAETRAENLQKEMDKVEYLRATAEQERANADQRRVNVEQLLANSEHMRANAEQMRTNTEAALGSTRAELQDVQAKLESRDKQWQSMRDQYGMVGNMLINTGGSQPEPSQVSQELPTSTQLQPATPPAGPASTQLQPAPPAGPQPATPPAGKRKTKVRVTIVSARNLHNADFGGWDKSDPYCECEIRGKPASKFLTPYINGNLNPEWQHTGEIEVFEEGDVLDFNVFDYDSVLKMKRHNDPLGKAQLSSAQVFAGFNGELPLISKYKEEAFLRVIVQPDPPPLGVGAESVQAPKPPAARKAAPSKVEVTIVRAKNLRNADIGFGVDKSDPYCECQIPGKTASKTKTQHKSNDLNPIWNHRGIIEGFQEGDTLEFNVYDHDSIVKMKKKPDFLGKAVLSYEQILDGFDGELSLESQTKQQGIIQVIVKPLYGPSASTAATPADGQTKALEAAAPAQRAPAHSTVQVTIVRARNLHNADLGWLDKSDPYCQCEIAGRPTSSIKTAVKNNDLNPIWNHVGVIEGFGKGDTLDFNVYDAETALKMKQPDHLGKARLTYEEVISGFDGELRLESAYKEEAYLQVVVKAFAPQSYKGPPPGAVGAGGAEAAASTAGELPKKPKISAVQVTMVRARNLHNTDLGWIDKSDPYCQCEIPGKPSSKIKTAYKKDDLNPVWNHIGVIEGVDEGDTLEFNVYDYDSIIKLKRNPDFLGKARLTWEQILNGFNDELRLESDFKEESFLHVIVKGLTSQDDIAAALAGATPSPTEPVVTQEAGQAASSSTGALAKVNVTIVRARNLHNADTGILGDKSDPYCECEIIGKPATKFKTEHKNNNLNPVWNHAGAVDGFLDGDIMEFSVYDYESAIKMKKPDLLGKARLTSKQVLDGFNGELRLESRYKEEAFLEVIVAPVGQTPPAGAPAVASAAPAGQGKAAGPAVVAQGLIAAAGGKAGAPAGAEATAAPQPAASSATPKAAPVVAQPGGKRSAKVDVTIVSARNLRNADSGWFGDKSDPYCECQVQGKPSTKFATEHVNDNLNPSWNHAGSIEVFEDGDTLEFSVYDFDPKIKMKRTPDELGKAQLTSQQVFNGFDGELPLVSTHKGHSEEACLKVRVKATLPPVSSSAGQAAPLAAPGQAQQAGPCRPTAAPEAAPPAKTPPPTASTDATSPAAVAPPKAAAPPAKGAAPAGGPAAQPPAAAAQAVQPQPSPAVAPTAATTAPAKAVDQPQAPQQPAAKASQQPAAQAPVQPAVQPAAQAPAQPAAQPPQQPTAQPPQQPAAQPPQQPAVQPPQQPATQAPQQPAAKRSAKVNVTIVSARNLHNADTGLLGDKSDPYVECEIVGKPSSKFKTAHISNNLNPQWNHQGVIEEMEDGDILEFNVFDYDNPLKRMGKKEPDFLGKAQLTSDKVFSGFAGELRLESKHKEEAYLTVKVQVQGG